MNDSPSKRLPKKPAWFTTKFTSWEFPKRIPCARKVPRDATPIGTMMWSFACGLDRTDRYALSSNRGGKHLILWAGCRSESGRGWTFVPVAYGPAKGPNGESINGWTAALHLLVAAWRGEKKEMSDFEPPFEVYGLLKGDDFEAVCREVWPEHWEEDGEAGKP